MRVLLVAPQTDLLYVAEEVEEIMRSGLLVTPLLGTVTIRQLIREIRAGSYDLLWFATHGSEEGLLLSDGEMSAGELVALVRERFRLVVLNSCRSLGIAQLLQEEGNVDVICTIVDIPDRRAFQTGALLANALYKSGDIGVAYRLSKPGENRFYLYLTALLPTQATIAAIAKRLQQMGEEIAALRVQIGRLGGEQRRVLLSLGFVLSVSWLLLLGVWVF